MRIKLFLAAVLLSLGIVLPGQADAFCCERVRAPDGWGRERVVRHWVYYPRYRHVYYRSSVTDPYQYRYEPRGYYPYYNSGYWRPASEIRARKRVHYVRPAYYKAWGSTKRGYHHRRWHLSHHGRHRHHHW